MRQITDTKELRTIQTSILDNVHAYCESHGLRYFLSSGSLIGAVRHKGYIPWDDDIDIYMPRRDYEIFIETYTDENGIYRAINPSREKHYYYTFAKVIDTRTLMVEDETKGFKIGVYMDIFPVDYVPDDEAQREKVFKKKKLLYKIRRCKISHSNPLHSRLAYLCYRYLPISLRTIDKMIRELVVRDKPTNTVCNMSEAGPSIKGCFPATDIASTVDILFEGKTYKTMVGYKDYLERTYGDYMTLPPVDQRDTHHFEAYWL